MNNEELIEEIANRAISILEKAPTQEPETATELWSNFWSIVEVEHGKEIACEATRKMCKMIITKFGGVKK